MVKTVLHGAVKGARRRDENIKEWTGIEFGDTLRTAEDRERVSLQWRMWFPHDCQGTEMRLDEFT